MKPTRYGLVTWHIAEALIFKPDGENASPGAPAWQELAPGQWRHEYSLGRRDGGQSEPWRVVVSDDEPLLSRTAILHCLHAIDAGHGVSLLGRSKAAVVTAAAMLWPLFNAAGHA
jgi:hypothetical protein